LTITRPRRPSAQETQEETMHPVIIRQLAADHIREIHAKAEDERRGRRSPGQAFQPAMILPGRRPAADLARAA
jgi:hypothetical protein